MLHSAFRHPFPLLGDTPTSAHSFSAYSPLCIIPNDKATRKKRQHGHKGPSSPQQVATSCSASEAKTQKSALEKTKKRQKL